MSYEHEIRIVGIDPGSINLGFASVVYDIKEKKIKHAKAWSIKSDKIIGDDRIAENQHSERFLRIQAQKKNLLRLLKFYNPSVVCCETPFFNMLRPSAFAPLVEILFSIRETCFYYNPTIPFIGVEPKLVKRTFGAGANADKNAMKNRIIEIKDEFYMEQDMDKLDEHSIDALAIVFTYINIHLKD